jgi:hypothetical protein
MSGVSITGVPSSGSLRVHALSHRLTVSEWFFKLAWSWHPTVWSPSPHYGLPVCTIMAPKCISNAARFRPRTSSPISLDQGPQVYQSPCSTIASNFAHRWPASATLGSLNRDLGVPLYVHKISASKSNSKYTELPPADASVTLLNHGVGVYLFIHSIVSFRRALNCLHGLSLPSSDMLCLDG